MNHAEHKELSDTCIECMFIQDVRKSKQEEYEQAQIDQAIEDQYHSHMGRR